MHTYLSPIYVPCYSCLMRRPHGALVAKDALFDSKD